MFKNILRDIKQFVYIVFSLSLFLSLFLSLSYTVINIVAHYVINARETRCECRELAEFGDADVSIILEKMSFGRGHVTLSAKRKPQRLLIPV